MSGGYTNGSGIIPTGTSMRPGTLASSAHLQRSLQLLRALNPDAANAVCLRQLHEVGIVQFRTNCPSVEFVDLVAIDIPEGVVVEDHRDGIDPVLDRRCKFL